MLLSLIKCISCIYDLDKELISIVDLIERLGFW
jgi:hypothetical protein